MVVPRCVFTARLSRFFFVQFEFVGGGWVQNDELVTSYEDTVTQMTEGHRFLLETFGEEALPKVGWQLDIFGHTSSFANLATQMVTLCRGWQPDVIDRPLDCWLSSFISPLAF